MQKALVASISVSQTVHSRHQLERDLDSPKNVDPCALKAAGKNLLSSEASKRQRR